MGPNGFNGVDWEWWEEEDEDGDWSESLPLPPFGAKLCINSSTPLDEPPAPLCLVPMVYNNVEMERRRMMRRVSTRWSSRMGYSRETCGKIDPLIDLNNVSNDSAMSSTLIGAFNASI